LESGWLPLRSIRAGTLFGAFCALSSP